MSRPMTPRPAAGRPPQRPSATTPSSRSSDPTEEANRARALPDFVEDGVTADLDPSNATSGGIMDETVTITRAEFRMFEYPNSPHIQPLVSLFLYLKRDDIDEPKEERFTYGKKMKFGISKDGNFPLARDKNYTLPFKFDTAVILLQSLKDSDRSAYDRFIKEGAQALVGLRVHMRRGKTKGQSDKAKPVLLIDAVEDRETVSVSVPASKAANPKSDDRPSANSEIIAIAETAVLELLSAQESQSIARKDMAKAVIQSDKWRNHDKRGEILTVMRDDSFFARDGAPWVFDGKTVSLES